MRRWLRRSWIVVGAALMVEGCVHAKVSDHLSIDGTAGAGFAGNFIAETVPHPAYSRCASKSATCADTLLKDSVDLTELGRYVWRPAISTGIVAHVLLGPPPTTATDSATPNRYSLGLGAHIAFVPLASGSTTPFPTVTINAGRGSTEAFFGVVFAPTDAVTFPPNAPAGAFRGSVRVPITATGSVPNFIASNTREYLQLYFGIQIGGVRQSQQTSGSPVSAKPPVAPVAAPGAVAPVAAPTGIVLNPGLAGTGLVTVVWGADPTATYYRVDVSRAGGSYTVLHPPQTSATPTYVDTEPAGTNLQYTVSACNAGGCSPASAPSPITAP